MAKIIIPTPLRKFTNNEARIEISGSNIEEALSDLTGKFPALKDNIFDGNGQIRQFVRIYLGEEDIKVLENEKTPVGENEVISIIPAIAGGIA